MQVPRIGRLLANSALGCGLAIFVSAPSEGAHARHFQAIYSFKGGNDGDDPPSGVISDKDGNLYGATIAGGGTGCNGYGCGTVFKLAPDGTETVLYSFKGGSDGVSPLGGLIRDKQGNLYGTTQVGGGTGCYGQKGCGTIYKIAPDGTETVLYAFKGGSDGYNPARALLRDRSGNLYGTTYQGGSSCDSYGCGTLFELAPNGTETVLHAFCVDDNLYCADGRKPLSTLVMDKAGDLYGTTTASGPNGVGTVFKFGKGGELSTLYSFCAPPSNCYDGEFPSAGVVMDDIGNLYGTTEVGGEFGWGAVFRLAPDGTETVLHSFDAGADGGNPEAGVILGREGALYGTLTYGGISCQSNSAVFRLAANGNLKRFCSPSYMNGGAIEKNGSYFGTIGTSGEFPHGAIFAISKKPRLSR